MTKLPRPMPTHLVSEMKTITAMVKIYCRSHHDSSRENLCQSCNEFLLYAEKRLTNCSFADQKPTCGKCPIHCYRSEMQDKAKLIMRYSGPRMLWRHPIMAVRHLLNERKKVSVAHSSRQAKKDRPK